MSPNAQRIAIAEACGWTCVKAATTSGKPRSRGDAWFPPGRITAYTEPPDYLDDLNAIHTAEKLILAGGPFGLNRELRRKWRFELWQVVSRYDADLDEEDMIHASAAERAEAFLRALGKWREA